jgi:hypothetical protein
VTKETMEMAGTAMSVIAFVAARAVLYAIARAEIEREDRENREK